MWYKNIHTCILYHPYWMLLCKVMRMNNPESCVHNGLVAEKVGSHLNPRTSTADE